MRSAQTGRWSKFVQITDFVFVLGVKTSPAERRSGRLDGAGLCDSTDNSSLYGVENFYINKTPTLWALYYPLNKTLRAQSAFLWSQEFLELTATIWFVSVWMKVKWTPCVSQTPHLKPNNSPPQRPGSSFPSSPVEIFIIPLLRRCIRQSLRQVLIAKCQGLLLPPVVFTSSSLPFCLRSLVHVASGRTGSSRAPRDTSHL